MLIDVRLRLTITTVAARGTAIRVTARPEIEDLVGVGNFACRFGSGVGLLLRLTAGR